AGAFAPLAESSALAAGRSATDEPRWCAEMASTRSPLRILEPPVMPSWPARTCSWANFNPANPADLGAAAEVTVSVTKDPSPSMAGPIFGAAMISVRCALLRPPRGAPGRACNGMNLRFHCHVPQTAGPGNGGVHSLNQVSNGSDSGITPAAAMC